MKKILALALALCMILALGVTASADDDADYSGYTIRIYSNSNSTERTTWLIQEAKEAGFTISIDDNSVISGDTAAVQAANENKDGDLIFGLNETRWGQLIDGKYENLKVIDWTPSWADEVGEFKYDGKAYGIVIQNVLMLYRTDELGTKGEELHFDHWADVVDSGYTWYRQNKIGGTTNANINSAMLYPFTDPDSPAGGISIDGWKALWKFCADGKSGGDDYKYGFDPLNKGDVAISEFYSSALYGKIDAAADGSEHPLVGAPTPENWDVVDIKDGTYYIAEYIGILDKAGRSEEETAAVKAFCEWFGSAEVQADWADEFDGSRHGYDLCGICRGSQRRVDQHHDEPRLLLGRRIGRQARTRLGQPRLGDADAGRRVVIGSILTFNGELALPTRHFEIFPGGNIS